MKINILYSWLSLNRYWFRECKYQMTNMDCENQDFSFLCWPKQYFLLLSCCYSAQKPSRFLLLLGVNPN